MLCRTLSRNQQRSSVQREAIQEMRPAESARILAELETCLAETRSS